MSYELDPPPGPPPPPPPPEKWATPYLPGGEAAKADASGSNYITPAVTVEFDDTGAIASDIVCRMCDYNLRGLTPEGACPECGTAVGWSLHGDFLQYANPEWVKQLADATGWLAAGILVSIVSSILGSMLGSAVQSPIVSETIGLGAALVSFVGFWKLTTPEPGSGRKGELFTVRSMTRIFAICSILGAAFSVLVSSATVGGGPLGAGVGFGSMYFISLVFSMLGMIGSLLGFILLMRIARRIPDGHLESRTRTILWGFIVLFGLAIGGGVIAGVSGGGIGGLFGVGACVSVIGLLVFTIWWILILFQYRDSLLQATRRAQATWWRESNFHSDGHKYDEKTSRRQAQ